MRLALVGGSYSTRSIIASAQRCINYYPETNPRSAIIPMTHYQRPGLNLQYTFGNAGPIRCIYEASNLVSYVVSGNQLFQVGNNDIITTVGTIGTSTGPVSIQDNGVQALLVDGSTTGYIWTLGQSNLAPAVDPSPSPIFNGANQVAYCDGYILWNLPNSPYFGSTLNNSGNNGNITFDNTGLFYTAKNAYPDNLLALLVNRREIFLFGSLKSETWYNAGVAPGQLPPFPFQIVPGTYIEHGIVAPFSVASNDINVYWLSRDLSGQGVVYMFRGYLTQRISNHALENAILEMSKTVGISDALGFTYQIDGHLFYMLTFPAGDQTWVYDGSIQDETAAWHQECWTDPASGALHRHRANAIGNINGWVCAGDWQTSAVYRLDIDQYYDVVPISGVGPTTSPITCIRTFPHIGQARAMGTNQAQEINGHRLQFSAFRADIESGMATRDFQGRSPPEITLRWSDDRGRTFGEDVLQSNGAQGEYLTQPQWLGMGIARDRLFEIEHTIMGPAAFNGAWIDAEVLGS